MSDQKDTAQLEEEIRRLEKMVYYDELTKALNRRGFIHEVSKIYAPLFHSDTEFAHLRRNFIELSVLFLDIDDFKKINDTHGHAVGDTVLQLIAELLKKNTREQDLVARWGGEEFIVALVGANSGIASLVAERIRQDIEWQGIPVGHDTIRVTASIGVATHAHGENFDQLVVAADQLMYESKKAGKNRITIRELK